MKKRIDLSEKETGTICQQNSCGKDCPIELLTVDDCMRGHMKEDWEKVFPPLFLNTEIEVRG